MCAAKALHSLVLHHPDALSLAILYHVISIVIAFFACGLKTHVCSLLVVLSHLLHLISTLVAWFDDDTKLRRNPSSKGFAKTFFSSHRTASVSFALAQEHYRIFLHCVLFVERKSALHILKAIFCLINILICAFFVKCCPILLICIILSFYKILLSKCVTSS